MDEHSDWECGGGNRRRHPCQPRKNQALGIQRAAGEDSISQLRNPLPFGATYISNRLMYNLYFPANSFLAEPRGEPGWADIWKQQQHSCEISTQYRRRKIENSSCITESVFFHAHCCPIRYVPFFFFYCENMTLSAHFAGATAKWSC